MRDGVSCGGDLKETTRTSEKRNLDGSFKRTVTLRCTKKGCQTFQSIRKGYQFFSYTDLNGRCNSKLTLTEIMELVWYWVHLNPVQTTVLWTGRSNHTVVDWYILCRDVAVDCFSIRQKMGGQGCIVEIDESLFRGKRKYNRGCLLCSDQRTGNEENEEPLNNDETEQSTEEN